MFTDIDDSHFPYRSSKQARQAMAQLAREHGLGFLHNPGGGAFNKHDLGQCQISTYDDIEDFETLKNWLISKGFTITQ